VHHFFTFVFSNNVAQQALERFFTLTCPQSWATLTTFERRFVRSAWKDCTEVGNKANIGSRATKTAIRSRTESTRLTVRDICKLYRPMLKASQRANDREVQGSKTLKQTEYQRASKQPSWRGKGHPLRIKNCRLGFSNMGLNSG